MERLRRIADDVIEVVKFVAICVAAIALLAGLWWLDHVRIVL